jgi:hypothetical protein
MRSGAIEVEARPQVDASDRLQTHVALLSKELAAHPLIRPFPSAVALAEGVSLREHKRSASDDTGVAANRLACRSTRVRVCFHSLNK